MADTAPYCGQCGKPIDGELSGRLLDGELSSGALGGELSSGERSSGLSRGGHPACIDRAALEPPRFCPHCARRMVVQVDPMGWRAVCSRHGEQRG